MSQLVSFVNQKYWKPPRGFEKPLCEGDIIHVVCYSGEIIGEVTNHDVLGWGFKPIAFTSREEWHEDVVYAASVWLDPEDTRTIVTLLDADELYKFRDALETKSRRFMELASIDPETVVKKTVVGNVRRIQWED